MPKRDPHHPSLRGYQVSRWLTEGILKASRLGDTPVLVVEQAVRVRLLYGFRTTLSQGIFLVPRWIPAPTPDLKTLTRLSADREEQKKMGLIYHGDKPWLLIFQQVADLYAAARQSKHVALDREQTEFFKEKITPHILARRGAAVMLARCRVRDLQGIQRGLALLLGRLQRAGNHPAEDAGGMIKYLDALLSAVEQITERPFVVRRKRAQRSLRSAQRWIEEGKFVIAAKRVRKAVENLNPLAEA